MPSFKNIEIPHADLAIILGSGYTFNPDNRMRQIGHVPYLKFLSPDASSIFSESDGATFHETKSGHKILIFNCRLHRYQGFSPNETMLPIRIAQKAGVDTVLITNASGGLNPQLEIGQFMVIKKQIVVEPIPDLSPDFPPETIRKTASPYNPELSEILNKIIKKITGKSFMGTYAQVTGPAYETAAEASYLQTLGADAVGMSTALESAWGFLNNLKIVGLSLITNTHVREQKAVTAHADVLAQVALSKEIFDRIISDFLDRFFNE